MKHKSLQYQFQSAYHLLGSLLGEYLALTGARLNAKEMVAAGLATHFVLSEVRL
jgi:3-hydroxyisobutyryl-CoA hydrolase